ncbi:hypothetical protein H3C70_04380 [Patescibacteria group bacterium]|nr:hypothetical protein [Patescibacteria group bacterium]
MNNSSGFFLDSGNIADVKRWAFLVGGVTTNQVILFSKDKVTDIPKRITEIVSIISPEKSLSIELPDSEWSEEKLFELGKRYHSLSPENVVIKVPITTTCNKGLVLIHKFAQEGIRTNATVGMNFGQLTMAAEAGRSHTDTQRPNFVSLFWARTQESRERHGETVEPADLLRSVKQYIQEHNLLTKIIVGSIRTVDQVREAFSAGADIVTIPPTLLDELLKNKRAEETIQEFDQAFRATEKDIKLL